MPFKPGYAGGPGRPKGSKNTLPIIRDKLFRILLRRITSERDLESVDTTTLIKFAAACLPKDMSLSVNRDPQITYISNVPRPEVNNEYLPINNDEDNEDNAGVNTEVVDTHKVIDSG
jgi:hypothetical protein